MLFAQITDTHINTKVPSPFKGRSASKQLAAIISHLNHLNPAPDFVLLTGDCVHEGEVAEYQELKRLLQDFKMPCYILPGNHDNREHLKTFFPELKSAEYPFIQHVIEKEPIRLIGLDTVSEGHTHGEVCEVRLAWLDKILSKEPDKPTILFMHHPPKIYGFELLDKYANQDTKALGEVLSRHAQVQTILCGHFHQALQTSWENKIVNIAGSTIAQFSLNRLDNTKLEISEEPPAFALHRWNECRLITNFGSIPLVL